MAVPATLPLACEAGTSIAIPRGVRGVRRRSQATAPSGMAPFCISAPSDGPRGRTALSHARRDRWPTDGGGCGALRGVPPYWPELSAAPRTSPRRSRSPPRRRSPRPAQAFGTAKGPNAGRLSISAGVDWTSAYFFRGIKQETEDLILQPYGELGVKLVDQAGASPPSPSPAASGTASTPAPRRTARSRGSQGLVRVRRLRPPLRRPRRRPHDLRALHRLHEPQRSLRHGPGDRLRGGLQRREAPGPFRAQPGVPDRVRARRPGRRRRGQGHLRPGRHRSRLHVPGRLRLPRRVSVPLAFIPPDFGKWLDQAPGVTVLYLDDNLQTINDGDRSR